MANKNQLLFRAWTNKIPYGEEIKKETAGWIPGPVSDINLKSEYSETPARIRGSIALALYRILNVLYKNAPGSLGGVTLKDDNLGVAVEAEENGERIAGFAAQNAQKSDEINIFCTKENGSYVFGDGHDNGVFLLMTVLAYEIAKGRNGEFCSSFKKVRDLWRKAGESDGKAAINSLTEEEKNELTCETAIICANVYSRITGKNESGINILNETGNCRPLTKMAISRLLEQEISLKAGQPFKIFNKGASSVTSSPETFEIKDIKREWSEDEKLLIPELPKWYVVPEECYRLCTLINKSIEIAEKDGNDMRRINNILLRGPSSTGKTSMVQAVAAMLKRPYLYITCSSDTELSAFLGEPMYDKNGNVRYVESPFIRAIKNGYIIEVQEPYTIAKQGVLTGLNGLMDTSNGVTLPTGEYIRRHKDTIVFFTTNVSYVGCKKPNQSVLRRMNVVMDVNMPSEKEIIKRVVANTGFDNTALLKRLVRVQRKIEDYLRNEMIDDGVCGIAELIDWVSAIQITDEIVGSAAYTIVSKATDDAEEQSKITAIIEAELSGSGDF